MARLGFLSVVPTFIAFEANADMPRYDVKAYCTQLAGLGGTYSEMMYDGCFQQEQSAYDGLKTQWDALPARMQDYCDQIATVGGGGSYMMLDGCVQMEKSAGGTSNEFKY